MYSFGADDGRSSIRHIPCVSSLCAVARRCSIPYNPCIDFVGAGGRTCLLFAFLLSCSGLAAPPSQPRQHGISMRGDFRSLACIKPPRNIGSDGFNIFQIPCTRLPQLLTSWALVCSLRCRFIAESLLSGPARCRIGTVPWICALSPVERFHQNRGLYSVLLCQRILNLGSRNRQPDSMRHCAKLPPRV
jgi:hypothetical protein